MKAIEELEAGRIKTLPIGSVIQSGDLFESLEGDLHAVHSNGTLYGIRVVGAPIVVAGSWFRSEL